MMARFRILSDMGNGDEWSSRFGRGRGYARFSRRWQGVIFPQNPAGADLGQGNPTGFSDAKALRRPRNCRKIAAKNEIINRIPDKISPSRTVMA